VLHLIFQSPIDAAVLKRIDSGDIVVFLENAALRTLQNNTISNTLTQQLSSNRFCVLAEDIAVRGIAPD
jgi:tRNA 2-thiouridine synthesizing protein B